MHIVVCVKAVPSSTEVKMDPVTHTIVRDGRESVVNPFDAAALEVALAIKDERTAAGEGCRVSVLSMGIPATEALLRDGIARGASDALLLSDRALPVQLRLPRVMPCHAVYASLARRAWATPPRPALRSNERPHQVPPHPVPRRAERQCPAPPYPVLRSTENPPPAPLFQTSSSAARLRSMATRHRSGRNSQGFSICPASRMCASWSRLSGAALPCAMRPMRASSSSRFRCRPVLTVAKTSRSLACRASRECARPRVCPWRCSVQRACRPTPRDRALPFSDAGRAVVCA